MSSEFNSNRLNLERSNSDHLNVVLNFHKVDQFSARILLELLMSLEEGIETHYYLQYGDPESTLEIQETLSKFLTSKQAILSTSLPDLSIPQEWIENDPNQQSVGGNHTYKNRTQKEKIFQWNLSIFKYIHQLDHFLAIEPDCLFLKHQWAQPLYQAFRDRKQPILGHLKQGTINHQLVPTHFAGCSIYDGVALRKLPLEKYFYERYENPWWPLRDRPGTTTANNAFFGPVFSGYDASYDYLLYALYLRELTGSNDPLDWPSQCFESREDLIVCDFRSRLTIEAIQEKYYGKLPLLHGVKDDSARQVVLRMVRSQGLADRLLYPIGGVFAAPALDRNRPVDQPSEDYRALNVLRPDNSGLLSIADLRGKFAKKRCFIIGNGPSLKQTDLSRLKHEFTFGLNRIYLNYAAMGFEPTFYCCVNPNVTGQFAEEIDRLNSIKFVTDRAKESLNNHWNTFFMQSIPKIGFNENLENLAWHEGWTVTYCAMQVAFHLGFEEVILVGVDHYFKDSGEPNKAVTATGPDANHFHPEYFGKGVVWQYPDLERSEQSYRIAKEVYDRHNRHILDATINGHLQIFPKVSFDDITHNLRPAQPSASSPLSQNSSLSPEEQEKALVKRHPYPFAIFLPTEKIPSSQRIEGLQRVIDIYETKYQSTYQSQLKALREQCKGRKRAFVIGNGPSLNQTDLTLLKDEITFGVNGIFLKFEETEFRPTFYVVEDHLVAEDRQEAINQLHGPIKLFPIYLAYCLNEGNDTVFYNHVPRRSYPNGFDFSTDASDRTYTGCTVTFSCLQLAYYFGFQEIYLIGVDCDYEIPKDVEEKQEYSVTTLDMKSDDTNHFHPDYFGKGFRWHDPQVGKMRDAYAEARKVCEANGVTIYNATIGGKLEVFPRVDYYSLFTERPAAPRLLVIDLTRIGENTATGQMKQALFQGWPQERLLQVYITGQQRFGLYSPQAEQPIEHYTDTDALLTACVRFAPDVIYYRPVADHPYLHDFACTVLETLNAATVIHIVDDWPQRLQKQNPALFAEFDRSLRTLFHKASVCLSICQAMSTAFQERYGVEFIPIANCIDPADWTPTKAGNAEQDKQNTDRPFTIRYVGSLAADMTLESVLDVARAVAELQSEVAVRLEIYTLKLWKDKVADAFAGLAGVSIHESGRSLADYRQLLMDADALLVAYNFDPDSIAYVRYSMANKFPECLASGTPLLVYGPIDVATVAYAAEIGCTQLVLDRNPEQLKTTLRDLIANPGYGKTLAKVARRYAFAHHSIDQVRTQFHTILHHATAAKPTLRWQQPIDSIPQSNGHSSAAVNLLATANLSAASSPNSERSIATLASDKLSLGKTAVIGPKVSVIMPAYNAADTIQESIQSLQNQDYQNWELLVINDFSRDHTAEVVKKAQSEDNRIKLYDNQGIGTSAARNTGLDRAEGEFITFLDADDILYEGALTKRVAALQAHPEWSVVACTTYLSDGNFQPLGREIRIGKPMFTFTDSYRNLHPNSLMGRAEVLKRFDFDGEHDGVEDWVYLSRLLRSGYCVFEVNDCAVAYRLRDNSVVTADFKTHEDRCLKVLDLLYGPDPKCPDAKPEFVNGLTLPFKPIVIANRQIGLLTQLVLRRQHRSISRLLNEMDLAIVKTLSDEEITDQIQMATIRTCYCHTSEWQTALATQGETILTVCQRANIHQLLPHYTALLLRFCGIDSQPISAMSESVSRRRHRFARVVLGHFSREQGIRIDETQVVAHLMADLPKGSVMVDVGAHFGTALKPFAEQGWRIFAYEPDPDNRQILMQRTHDRPNVTIDNRAVSDQAGRTLTLYASQESTGISTLTPFRDSHAQRCQVMTTTVAQICTEHQLSQIDFLKIDTEGYDLMVLKGVPWEQIQPQVIECEFEDNKTVPLGYTFHDLAQYLVDRGYTVLVSEWHPVIRYGIAHDWYRLITYPCQLATPQAWGNLLAFKEPPDLDRLSTIAQKLVKAKAVQPPIPAEALQQSMNRQMQAIEGQNGMNLTPLHLQTNSQPSSSQSSNSQPHLGQNGHSSPAVIQSNEIPSAVNETSSPEPGTARLATGLLRRISRYYSRWPLGVALLAAALNASAMVDDLPFRWAFSGSSTLLLLFLVGHAASKADVSLEAGDRARATAEQADQKATSAFNRGTRAIDRAKKALKTANESSGTVKSVVETVDRLSNLTTNTTQTAQLALGTARSSLETARSAVETANNASGKTEVSLETVNRVSGTVKSAMETANRALGKANVAMETAASALETANHVPAEVLQLKRSNSFNVGLFQPFDRQLSSENLDILADFWLPTLNLTLDRRALGYLAHRICLCEDTCSGRLATSVQDMLLRLLVARSVKHRELSVLEIGSLFGINLATIYDTCRGHFETIHLSAIDPLAGYYDKSATDMITQVPITRKIFEHNLRQIDVPVQDVTLIQGLSTETDVLEKAGLRQYNLLIIDGDHSYTGVKFDFDHYASAVDLGGYILFDDYGTKDWPEVTEFVDQEVKANSCVEFVGASWRTAVFKVIKRNLG